MTNIGDETAHYDIGPHQLTLTRPNIATVVWRGVAKTEHLRSLHDHAEAYFGPNISFCVIADVTSLTAASAETRKFAANEPRAALISAIAFVGASFHMRVLMTMFHKATVLINKPAIASLVFFSTVDEASQWVDVQRQRHSAG